MSNPVVSDKMRYGLKPIAVESKAHLLTVPCVGTNLYSGDTSSTIIFRIQHNPSGRYIDPTATKFKMTLQFSFPDFLTASDTFFLERGPESIIRRFTIKDIQGRVLEDIDQYNMLYGITEICTGDPLTRQRRGQFTLEGNSLLVECGGWVVHPTQGLQNSSIYSTNIAQPNIVSFDITFTPLSGVFGGTCEKYIPLSVLEGLEIWIQLENVKNCLKYQFLPFPASKDAGEYKSSEEALNANDCVPTVVGNTSALPGGHYYTHSILKSYVNANGEAAKFSPNNLYWSDLIQTGSVTTNRANYLNGGEFKDGTPDNTHPVESIIGYEGGVNQNGVKGYQWNLKTARQDYITYTVKDPKLLLSCLDVEPAVNAALMHAAKDPRDGMVRIQTFSWQTFAIQISPNITGNFQWQIPVSVTSLKSLFFVLTNSSTTNDMNYFKTGFEHRGLLQYRVIIGGMPINADFINVTTPNRFNTYSESIGALMEAWSVHHKTDGTPTLLTLDNYCPARFDPTKGFWQRETCAIFGQELESFNQKSGIIQSGVNTMQTTFVLELNFSSATVVMETCPKSDLSIKETVLTYDPTAQYELRAFCMYDKVIAFDENSGSVRAEY